LMYLISPKFHNHVFYIDFGLHENKLLRIRESKKMIKNRNVTVSVYAKFVFFYGFETKLNQKSVRNEFFTVFK